MNSVPARALLTVLCAAGAGAVGGDLNETFRADLKALTAAPHRLAGSAHALTAGRYVEGRLRQIGVNEVHVQNFLVPCCQSAECTITVDGKTHDEGFLAMRPNHLQGVCTPAEGLTGPTLYAASGRLGDYRGSARDAIVVLDFAAGDDWRYAFAMGAKAVIFIGSDEPAPTANHHLNFPANLPRFYATADLAEKLKLKTRSDPVTVRAVCRWEMREGRSVIGVIRGTKPRFEKNLDEAILLTAPLDSLSEVPELSPGARGAGNCAALLALAEHLQADPPRRDVMVCFLDGEAANHAGARALYGSLYRESARGVKTTLADRLKMFQAEDKHYQEIVDVLALGNIFSDQAMDLPGHDAARLLMRREAKNLAGDRGRHELQLLRIRQRFHRFRARRLEQSGAARRGDQADRDSAAERISKHRGEVETLGKRIKPLEVDDIAWSQLERALHDQEHLDRAALSRPGKARKLAAMVEKFRREGHEVSLEELTTKILGKHPVCLEEVRGLCEARRRELALGIKHTRQGMALAEAFGPERNLIVLHLSLNLGDASPRWTFIHGQDSQDVHASKDNIGKYAKMFQAIRELAGSAGHLKGFEPRTVEGLFSVRMFAPGLFAHGGAVAGVFGVSNLAIMTPMDRRVRDGQPCDVVARPAPGGGTVEVLKSANMTAAVGEIRGFLRALADAEGMSLTSNISNVAQFTEASFSGGKYGGGSVLMLSAASVMPDRPARGAFMAVSRSSDTPAYAKTWGGVRTDLFPPGFTPYCISQVNMVGLYELPPVSRDFYAAQSVVLGAMFTDRGLIDYVTNSRTLACGLPFSSHQTVLFQADSVCLVGVGFDRLAINTRALKASSTAPLNDDWSLVAECRNVLAVFAKRGTDKVKMFNKEGMVILGNAPPADPVVGEGVPVRPFEHLPTVDLTAENLHRVNAGRLKTLRENRIAENSIERLHVESADVKAAAGKIDKSDVHRLIGTKAASAAISRRVYPPLLRVLNDLVVAVVLLLLLSMPFAFSLERLLVGTPHIYRQIGWFVVFFLITFAVLYVVNPAFRIAATPIVIFLAFGIILLSTIVIVIMTRKLQSEVRRMQGLSTTVHSADVSRLSTMMAAVSMGISTMRRRPIRTLLTAVTVVLLTFTILTFASFASAWGNRRTFTGPLAGPPRLMVRHPVWSRINKEICDMLAGFLRTRAEVVPRYWVAQSASEVQAYKQANRTREILVADAAGERITAMSALVGVDWRDVEQNPRLRDLLGDQAERLRDDGVFLTEAVAGEGGLDVRPGDAVCIDGVECSLAGVLDARKLTTFEQLEGSSVLPVDYEASGGGSSQSYSSAETTSLEDLPEMESAQFVNYGADRVAIVSAALARRLGGRVCSVNVYPAKGADIERMGNRVAAVTRLPTYLGARGGVYRLFFTSLTEASGWKDLIIPVVLGGLIIFATMLGSVSDREKEIYAFSALGLAPPHVASLFFAEASVYAVVGGMGGYLLGQVVSRGLNLVAEMDWFGGFTPPTMNYSSTNAIATVFVVMCTVLISTVYPALKASRSANPGIQRSWQIGKPKGDLYDIVFPFTVSAYDITGVVSFLQEHFRNFSDTALGVFATSTVHTFRQSDDKLGMRAEVALAPFDLGVSQRFALMAQPSEIEGIEEIRILLRRVSGTRGDWQRANRVFINELRKQLLIWRSLTAEIMERYRQNTLGQWDQLPVEDVRPETFGDNT